MNLAFALAFLAAVALTAAATETGGYTTKYDNLNIDEILKNNRLVENYVKCLLDKRRCNEQGRTLKEVIPDALITDCAKCNPKQREGVEKIIRFLVKNRRNDFDELAKKYDPTGANQSKYEKYLKDV